MKTLRDIEFLEGVKVLVRADFNVPVKNGVVTEDFRIVKTLPTIEFLRAKRAKIILISHRELGESEKNGLTEKEDDVSLKPVADRLNKLQVPVTFVKNFNNAATSIGQLNNGECMLLENLRFIEGEKENDKKFAKQLASLADIYVNDAFSVSHREHASVVGVPQFLPAYAGLQLESEVANLSKAFNPMHPFLFILGGAKFETKLPLLEKFMEIADGVFVAGALANDFFKEKGYEVGASIVSKENFHLARFLTNSKLILPVDVLNEKKEIKPADGLSPDNMIMDCGPMTLERLKKNINEAKFILWNGPLGLYEKGYTEGTLELARMISEATTRGVETIVGGGDTLAAIAELGIQDKFTFISTGGGAMLDFLAKGTLPGIEALNNSVEN